MTKKILIGDDQFGEKSDLRELFSLKYESVLRNYDVDYTNDPEEFVRLALTRDYHALMIDLRWGPELPEEGYRILDQVKNTAPIRILWTSETNEARGKGFMHSATDCIEKTTTPEELEKVLAGND